MNIDYRKNVLFTNVLLFDAKYHNNPSFLC